MDRVLRAAYPTVPLNAIMKALRTGAVRVDGRKCSGDVRLTAGSEIITPWGGEERALVSGGDRRPHPHIKTIYRDEDIWVADKPAGMLSQPDASGDVSFIECVWSDLGWDRNDFRPAAAGRLDRGVSGVIAAALNARTLRTLNRLFAERSVRKIYHAVTDRGISGSGVFDSPIDKEAGVNISRTSSRGRRSLTKYRVIDERGRWRLVELELITGRPHQARVHMASAGFPIAGDVKYGGTMCGARRVLLHAFSLTLPDDDALPTHLRGKVFEAPIDLLGLTSGK